MEKTALFTNDAVVFGLLMFTLGLIFYTSESRHPFWKKFYTYVPALLLCYFVPGLYNSLGVIEGQSSNLYFVASRYLLPASLVLFTISVDLKEIVKLGPKAGIMFITGTVGIILGGPFALWLVSFFRPDLFTGDLELWRGMSTVAGSWIGGGANQAAMLETFKPEMSLYTQLIAVDIIIANLWLGFLLYWSRKPQVMDKLLKADASQIEVVKERIEKYQAQRRRMPTFNDIMKILGVGFGVTGVAHLLADQIAPWLEDNYPRLAEYSLTSAFFWLVVIATTIGVGLSFTRVKNLEGAGAGKFASAFLYVLVATIGMQMNLGDVLDNTVFFAIGLIWILTHVIIMLVVARLIRAPFFFVAVGSQANVGGAASAPVVANAFHPSLVAVGVLLAVLGYAVGTYGAYICGILMKEMSEWIVGFL
jgi:uncharacterized membrane protein